MALDWDGARRKDLARRELGRPKPVAGKGSAVDTLFRLRAQVKRVHTVDWRAKAVRQREVALAELESLRERLVAARPGFAGGDIDLKARAAAMKLRVLLDSGTGLAGGHGKR